MSDNLKDVAPLERAPRPGGGFFNKKGIIGLTVAVVGVVSVAAYVFTIRGEDQTDTKVADVNATTFNVDDARPSDFNVVTAETVETADTGQGGTADAGKGDGGTKDKGEAKPKRKGPPENWKRASAIVMRRGGASQQGTQAAQGVQGDRQSGGQAGYADGYGGQGGDDADGGGRGGRNAKMDFYAGGGAANAGGMDLGGELLPEAEGCVVKAGTQIMVQSGRRVRTSLPQKVLVHVANPVEGNVYLGNGRVSRCLAIPAQSTMLLEINSSGVERGDLRIQACALRLDLLGGGRRTMGCSPTHGADGDAGIEAESDYAVGGIVTGILIEAALSTVRGLGGLVGGVPGVAVQVGGGMVGDIGSEYVRRELMRPPVLSINAGAIFGVQVNGDLSMPLTAR